MNASRIPSYERAFFQTGVDASGKQHVIEPFTVRVPGTDERMEVVSCTRKNGDRSFYYRTESAKRRVVLHYTAGYLKGDIAVLTTPDYHVSTPFVVARDGRIYNLWHSKYWSYHLGKGARGGNQAMSRSGVGIEISNVGWLVRKGEELHTYFSKPDRPDVYCTLADTAYYTRIEPYRGREYFATFTDEQYRSVIQLLRYLTARYDIPREFLDPPGRYTVNDDIASFEGITSHVNYRSDGKWDIGPAFDWDRVITGVQAESEPPALFIPEPTLEVVRPAPVAPPVRTTPEPPSSLPDPRS